MGPVLGRHRQSVLEMADARQDDSCWGRKAVNPEVGGRLLAAVSKETSTGADYPYGVTGLGR